MSAEDIKKGKKCLFCKKTLLNTENVCCLRCLLEGRNKATTAVKLITGAAVGIRCASVAVNSAKNKK